MRSEAKKSTPPIWAGYTWYVVASLFIAALVMVSGYFLIRQQRLFLLAEKHKEIATIADLKTGQIVQWRNERFAEGASIRANAMTARRINDYFSGKDRAAVKQEFSHWMANLIDLGGYSRGMLFSPDGILITASSDSKTIVMRHYLDLVVEAAAEQELILSDFHADGIGAPFDIDLVIPIIDFSSTPHRCIAVLILDIEPEKRLYPLIRSWPTASESAETLLVRRDGESVLFMSELRHRKKSDEQFKLPLTDRNIPAIRAALGEEGNFDGVDYRNVPVISAIRTIPGTHWGMVVKIDRTEVLAPLTKYTIYVIISGLLIASALTLGVFLFTIRRKALTLQAQIEQQKKNEAVLQEVHAQLEQQISVRTQDLSEINSLLRQEIVERKQLEQQLLNAKKLEAIGQIAGGVAHEVRNPLNAILTVTEALFREKEIEGNPEFKPYIGHIKTQVTRLVRLMNDLLDLGRTIPEDNLLPTPLYKICVEALALWKSTGMAKNRGGVFIAEDNNISCIVLADDVKLQQVFFNLLENAGHHSAASDSIIMKLACHGDCNSNGMAVVQIIDHGSGIAEEKLAHVFDPFFTDRRGGTGLGLALVKHFTENMGGTVKIRNNSPPPGCTVEVAIPLNREDTR